MSDPIVTLTEILRLRPCAPQRAILREFIPAGGIPVNATTVAAARAAGLHVVWFASHTKHPDVLRALASGADSEGVRWAVACNPAAPADVLRALASDDNGDVRWAVALNRAAPADVLRALATDESRRVRYNAAYNRAAPVDALRTLASDDNGDVRWAVALNRAAPADVLRALASDPVDIVRLAATHTLTDLEGPC